MTEFNVTNRDKPTGPDRDRESGHIDEARNPGRLLGRRANVPESPAELEFEDLGDRTKLTQTMRFATTEKRDTTMQHGVEEAAKNGFAQTTRCSTG